MALYQYLRETWQSSPTELVKPRLIEWRRSPAVVRIERPTKLHTARSKGYKPIQGILLARVRLLRGGRMRPRFPSGRKSKNYRRKKILNLNYQTVAEQRANKIFPNCEVLNSYYVAKDGLYYWFEVILVDRAHPRILNHKDYSFIFNQRGRVYRGLTSSARKSRGLRNKGKGAEKIRPSKAASIRIKNSRKYKIKT